MPREDADLITRIGSAEHVLENHSLRERIRGIAEILSSVDRLQILLLLAQRGTMASGEIAAALNRDSSTTSHQLTMFRLTSLVVWQGEGPRRRYDVARREGFLALLEALESLRRRAVSHLGTTASERPESVLECVSSNVDAACTMFSILVDPRRIELLLRCVVTGEQTAAGLMEGLHNQVTDISRFLRALIRAGLIKRTGRHYWATAPDETQRLFVALAGLIAESGDAFGIAATA